MAPRGTVAAALAVTMMACLLVAPSHAIVLKTRAEMEGYFGLPLNFNFVGGGQTKFGYVGGDESQPQCLTTAYEFQQQDGLEYFSLNTCAGDSQWVLSPRTPQAFTADTVAMTTAHNGGGTAALVGYDTQTGLLKGRIYDSFDVCVLLFGVEPSPGVPGAVIYTLEGSDVDGCDIADWTTASFSRPTGPESPAWCDMSAQRYVNRFETTSTACPANSGECTYATDCPATGFCDAPTCVAGACQAGASPEGMTCSANFGTCGAGATAGTCVEPVTGPPLQGGVETGVGIGAWFYTYTMDSATGPRCIPAASSALPISPIPSDCTQWPNACSYTSLCNQLMRGSWGMANVVGLWLGPEAADQGDALKDVPGMTGHSLPSSTEGGGGVLMDLAADGIAQVKNCDGDGGNCEVRCAYLKDVTTVGGATQTTIMFYEFPEGTADTSYACNAANYPDPADPSTWNAACSDNNYYLRVNTVTKMMDCSDPTLVECRSVPIDDLYFWNNQVVTDKLTACEALRGDTAPCVSITLPNGAPGYVVGPSAVWGVHQGCNDCETKTCNDAFQELGG